MDARWTAGNTHPAPPGFSFWWLLTGVLIGFFVLLGVQLKLQWFVFIFLGSMIFTVSLAVGNKKDYYLVLFVLALPVWIGKHLYFSPSPYGISTFGFPIHVSLLPLTVLYVIWAVRRAVAQEAAPVATRGWLPLAGVFLAASVSVMGAHDQLFGVFDLFALGTSMLIFLYAAGDIRQLHELRLVLGLLIFSAALQGLIALAQYVTGSSLGMQYFQASRTLYGYTGLEAVSRASGLLGHPNNLALFFDLMLPVSVSLLFCPLGPGARFLLAVGVFLQVAGLGVTFSRGGIMASGLGILALVIFQATRRLGLARALLATLAGALLLAAFLMIVPNPIAKGLSRTEKTASGRLALVEVALTMIRHHPLFGVGLNNFTHASRPYDSTREQIVSAWNSPVHNLFLFIAGEIGLVGLACFVVFLVRVVTALLPALRAPDAFISSVGVGLLCGLLAFLIHAQVDYSIWTQNRPLWFFLGLAMGVGRFVRPAAVTSAHGIP
jgi:putative inorganic carbon (hco3(-)) transporter